MHPNTLNTNQFNTLNTLQQFANPQASLFPIPFSETDRTVLRNGIRFYTSHIPAIPYPVVANYFKYYKKLFWSAAHILESIEAGMIVREDICFQVKYHKNLTRGKILAAAKENCNTQFMLSFRAPYDGWNIDPVVLISAI